MNDKVSFLATIDDIATVMVRNLEVSGQLKKNRQDAAVISSAAVGLLAYYGFPAWPEKSRLGLSLALALLCAVGQWFHYKRRATSRIREQMLKLYGGEGPFAIEFEAADDSLIYRASGAETKFTWGGMSLNASSERLEFVLKSPLTVGWIPRRAFRDEEQMSAWREFIAAKTRLKVI